MRALTGTFVEGKVVLAGAGLPDGAAVTVFAEHLDEKVHLPPRLQAEIEAALGEADREEGITSGELLEQLEKYR